jgi:hypothetical protein
MHDVEFKAIIGVVVQNAFKKIPALNGTGSMINYTPEEVKQMRDTAIESQYKLLTENREFRDFIAKVYDTKGQIEALKVTHQLMSETWPFMKKMGGS